MITIQNTLALSHVLVFNVFGLDCIFEFLFFSQEVLVL